MKSQLSESLRCVGILFVHGAKRCFDLHCRFSRFALLLLTVSVGAHRISHSAEMMNKRTQ